MKLGAYTPHPDPKVLEIVEDYDEEAAPVAVLDTRPDGPPPASFGCPRPACTATWVVPAITLVVVAAAGVVANAIADDFYVGLVAAAAACGAVSLLAIAYNVARILQARCRGNAYADRFFFLLFWPVGCLRWNAEQAVVAASQPTPPSPLQTRARAD